jgi:hypothetical protein
LLDIADEVPDILDAGGIANEPLWDAGGGTPQHGN